MKSMYRYLLFILAILLVLAAIFLPIPQRVAKRLDGLSYVEGEEPAPCTVELDGTLYRYLFKTDVYWGRMALSTDARTGRNGVKVDSGIGRGEIGFMSYLDDEYFIPGYFVAPKDFSWYYANMTAEDGTHYEIAAPADLTLEEARERAKKQLGKDVLLELVPTVSPAE